MTFWSGSPHRAVAKRKKNLIPRSAPCARLEGSAPASWFETRAKTRAPHHEGLTLRARAPCKFPIQFSNSRDAKGFETVIASQRVGVKRRPMTGLNLQEFFLLLYHDSLRTREVLDGAARIDSARVHDSGRLPFGCGAASADRDGA